MLSLILSKLVLRTSRLLRHLMLLFLPRWEFFHCIEVITTNLKRLTHEWKMEMNWYQFLVTQLDINLALRYSRTLYKLKKLMWRMDYQIWRKTCNFTEQKAIKKVLIPHKRTVKNTKKLLCKNSHCRLILLLFLLSSCK